MTAPSKTTILLYGRTNSGKSAQIGELAEHVFSTTGRITRLYTADRGGVATIKPYIDLGIVDLVSIEDSNPWIFLNKATKGLVRGAGGKWVRDDRPIGLYAFEGMRSFAEELMNDLAQQTAQGKSIGGGSNITFTISDGGENLKVSGNNQAHFGVVQNRMTDEIWASQKLDAPFIVWTSSVSKDDDLQASGKILGPDVIGKALTTETPRWFDLTMRLDVIPAQMGKPERHVLYLGSHVDVNAGNTAALGNIRLPLDAGGIGLNVIEPASIVKALDQLKGGGEKATEAIKRRLGSKLEALKKGSSGKVN